MQHTYSKPQIEWRGFRPVGYHIDLRRAFDLKLTLLSGEGDQKQSGATTLGTILTTLSSRKIEKNKSLLHTEIITSEGTFRIDGPSFNREIAAALLELQEEGINSFETEWFWYDKDHVTDDAVSRYCFFVVHGYNVVREQVSFCDDSDSGFDPTIFESNEDLQPIWRNHPEWDEARVRYLYQRFYSETMLGRLMVLRPDKPALLYYERPEERRLFMEMQLAISAKTSITCFGSSLHS